MVTIRPIHITRLEAFLQTFCRLLLLILPVAFGWFGRGVLDFIGSFIAVMFLVRSALTQDWQWLNQIWIRWFLVMWGYFIIRSFFAEFPLISLSRALPFGRYGVFAAALAYWVLNDRLWQKRMFGAIIFALAYYILEGVVQLVTGYSIGGNQLFYKQLSGPFDRSFLGIVILPLFLIVFGVAITKPSPQWLAWSFLALIPFGLIVLSATRAPFVLSLIATTVSVILVKRPIKWRVLVFIGFAVGLSVALIYFYQFSMDRLVGRLAEDTGNIPRSSYGRVWQDAFHMISAHPWFGVGGSHYRLECAKPDFQALLCLNHAHNIYLDVASEFGLIGLGLMLGCFISLYYFLWIHRRGWLDNGLGLGLSLIIVIQTWPLMGTRSFFTNWYNYPLWLAIGWLLALIVLEENKEQAHVST